MAHLMELRDLAERIVFGTTLEDKLECPRGITDRSPGKAIEAPRTPGRPTELTFRTRRDARVESPSIHHLDRDEDRGRLLHFFANHELLATELMALVLLKFPDAPRAFRQGVLATLRDEQRHTRSYLKRMEACGISFGELPVNGFFWRTISGMSHPIDYVSGLSLTFEQANLDYCGHFAGGFRAAGDDQTARLLQRIYRDEIGHVAYGLKWFRHWKRTGLSDWEAFCRQLKFPLSPNRAKGIGFNTAGREAAGLDRDFIDTLQIYSQSRGRTPSVFVFNPFVELHIAHGKAFHPVRQQKQLAADLANVVQFLSRQDDIVLVPRRPAARFLKTIQAAGFHLPEFIELKGTKVPDALHGRNLGRLCPWGWGPDSIALLSPLFGQVTAEPLTPGERWNDGVSTLYTKAWSAGFLQSFLRHMGNVPWLCDPRECGQPATTLDAALEQVERIRGQGHHRVVVKESLGLAGRNMIRLWEPEILPKQRRWMMRALAGGQTLIVEPWLDRTLDFSLQFDMGSSGLRRVGFVELVNDAQGQYRANIAASHWMRQPPGGVVDQLRSTARNASGIHACFEALAGHLEPVLDKAGYRGPVGVDALLYRDPGGSIRLKPVVEINPRFTMGRLTLELMRHVRPGRSGMLRLVNRQSAEAEGQATLSSFARAQLRRHPVHLDESRRIEAGTLCLNDPETAAGCLAVFQVKD